MKFSLLSISYHFISQQEYMSVEPLYEEIRQRIIERGAIGIRGIGRLFGIADDDGNKTIDIREEFPKLIHDIGLKYNKDQIAALSKDLDRG